VSSPRPTPIVGHGARPLTSRLVGGGENNWDAGLLSPTARKNGIACSHIAEQLMLAKRALLLGSLVTPGSRITRISSYQATKLPN